MKILPARVFRSRWTAALILPLLLVWHSQLVSYSDGPPTGRTGAPGELTCYNGSCHNSFPLNSGSGQALISANIPKSGYLPDSIYTLEAKITHIDAGRFGFELTAFDPQQYESVGTLLLTDTTGVEITSSGSREYIRHNAATVAADSTLWRFQWQAPPTPTGPIVFHAAFVAANNNNNRQGDHVYTAQLAIEPALATTALGTTIRDARPHIFANSDQLLVEMGFSHPGLVEIAVLDLRGKALYTLTDFAAAGDYRHTIPAHNWPKGIYLLVIRTPHTQSTQKVRLW